MPGGNREIPRVLLNGISGWLTFPFKYLDKALNHKPEAAHLAAAFYYLGRKPMGGRSYHPMPFVPPKVTKTLYRTAVLRYNPHPRHRRDSKLT